MFKEWKIQWNGFIDQFYDVKYLFKDFIEFLSTLGNMLFAFLMFIIFPTYYLSFCIYIVFKYRTYEITKQKLDKQHAIPDNVEAIISRNIPKRVKNNLRQWVNKQREINKKAETKFYQELDKTIPRQS